MGFVMGLVFVGIGLFVVIPSAGIFGVFWTIMAGVITVTNGINAFGKKGVASHEIQVEEEGGLERPENQTLASVEERLAAAKSLYDQGLISREEYEAKRAEILRDL